MSPTSSKEDHRDHSPNCSDVLFAVKTRELQFERQCQCGSVNWQMTGVPTMLPALP